MYPLNAILIGCESLPEVRRELGNLSIPVEGEYVDVGNCLAKVLANPSDTTLQERIRNAAREMGQQFPAPAVKLAVCQ